MRKFLPYIIAVLVTAAVVLLIATTNKRSKEVDQRVTLRRQDKIPYGSFLAYDQLKNLFPGVSISADRHRPGLWDSLSLYEEDQALFILAGQFNADETEMKRLVEFVEKGNDVFISTQSLSYNASDATNSKSTASDISIMTESGVEFLDTLNLILNRPPYTERQEFSYPGKKLDASFFDIDENITEILGEDGRLRPNFLRFRAGKGNLYIHLAPLAFTNYFLLHRNNIAYYEKALSVLRPGVRKIVWDEYFLSKKSESTDSKEQNWFSVLSRYPGLKAALLTALGTLLLYTLFEMRRKQRMIPVVARPRNDSLDFVKTIGRLYYDKGDHKNLGRKMSAYFLEYVRNKFKITTGTLDEEFIRSLQYKSGAGEEEIRSIISFIRYAEEASGMDARQLMEFHKQLEAFYKKA